MVAIIGVATMPEGGNKNGMLMNCPTIGWDEKDLIIWVCGDGRWDKSHEVG